MSGQVPNIVVIGSTTIDDVRVHPNLEKLEDGKHSAEVVYTDVGGGGANVAIAVSSIARVAQKPVDVVLFTKIGQPHSRYYDGLEARDQLQDYGVTVCDMASNQDFRIDRNPVISYAGGRFVSSKKAGFGRVAAPKEQLDAGMMEQIQDAISRADLVVLQKHYPQIVEQAAIAAQQHSVPVIIDYPEQDSTRAGLFEKTLSLSDYILAPAEARLRMMDGGSYKNGTKLFECLAREFPDAFIAVSDGANPVLARHNGHVSRIDVLRVQTIDQLGAGDARTGAFAYFSATGDDPLIALEKASRVSSLSVMHYGRKWVDDLDYFMRNDQVFQRRVDIHDHGTHAHSPDQG